MTDNDIKKALECCGAEYRVCRICPFESHCYDRGESLSNYALDLINRKDAEIEKQQYILMGVMHSVDKWLEGDELKQDEVNRASTMREKTLQIVEEQQAKIEQKQSDYETVRKNGIRWMNKCKVLQAEIEKLTVNKNAYALGMERLSEQLEQTKSEAIKEFAERLKERAFDDGKFVCTARIDNLVKEMTEQRKNDFKE